jgi:hypothetical protein
VEHAYATKNLFKIKAEEAQIVSFCQAFSFRKEKAGEEDAEKNYYGFGVE